MIVPLNELIVTPVMEFKIFFSKLIFLSKKDIITGEYEMYLGSMVNILILFFELMKIKSQKQDTKKW